MHRPASNDAGAGSRPPSSTEPEAVLATAAAEHRRSLGPGLLGLYVHGSWVVGDFEPARSDLDLLAVLAREPDESLVDSLGPVLSAIESAHPNWQGRVEVEYVALTTVVAFAGGRDDGPGCQPASAPALARVSPGESLHLLPASGHRLLTWTSVHDRGQALVGPAPPALLPRVDRAAVRSAALMHVRDWPAWVREMTGPGGQSYAVLTLCRALHLFSEGSQVSKRVAASHVATALPEWLELIDWARDWWYAAGMDDAPSRHDEVTRFVDDVSSRIIDRWGVRDQCGLRP